MVIQVLKKHTEHRTQVDIITLFPLVRDLQFFSQNRIQGKDLNDVCELLTYEYHPKGSMLSDINESGDRLSIILEGKVEFSID